jgi:hypothetical protein
MPAAVQQDPEDVEASADDPAARQDALWRVFLADRASCTAEKSTGDCGIPWLASNWFD